MSSFFSNFYFLSMFGDSITFPELITSWDDKPIASCVLGISKISLASKLIPNISHSALLLMKEKISFEDEDNEMNKRTGILIEYGNYSPDMNKIEKIYTEKGYVIYRYGDKGGLRYYTKKYGEFIRKFGDIGYIDLNIEQNNQKSFANFIDNVAKLEDNKWTKDNYSTFGLHNHSFVIAAWIEIKPYFNAGNIFPSDPDLAKQKYKKKLNFLPSNIKT